MTTEKVSLTLDEELVTAARDEAGRRGLSGYVNHALRRQLQHDRLTRLLREMDEEAGPVDPEVMEEVRRAWPAPSDERRSA
jgi:Arc/MetJ family transcription regulator